MRDAPTSPPKPASLSYAAEPSKSELVATWTPPVECGSILAGLLAAYLLRPRERMAERRERPDGMLLMILWAVVPPLLFFAVSRLTPYQVFVSRYLLCCVPGLALLAGVALRSIAPPRSQVIVAAALALGTTAGVGPLLSPTFGHTGENWRDANLHAARMVRLSPMPVLFNSG